jgi:hypothetical protein
MPTYMFWDYSIENAKEGKIEYDVPKEIEKAFNYFYSKFNIFPEVCTISPLIEKVENELEFDGHKVIIARDKMVALRNIWLGMSDKEKELKPKTMKTFEITLLNEKTKKEAVVQESGWDAEDMLAVLSTKYGVGYIVVKVVPSKYELSETVE